jgi:AraC-like DNA-binding protein
MVGAGYVVFLGWPLWPSLAAIGAKGLSLAAMMFAIFAATQTIRTWREDLIAGRRRFRIAILALNVIMIAAIAGSGLVPVSFTGHEVSGSLASALGLFAIAMLVGFSLFGAAAAAPEILAVAALPGGADPVPPTMGRDGGARDPIAPQLLRRLDHLMTAERAYRQEGLTIGLLAARLELPEYRLRQAINEGLGYRNFNAFLNRYRLDEAKAALADASQRDVPVLTIAMDAGFQSIGPFNRAFKADTGRTPTEFRRDALARLRAGAADCGGDRKIGHSG